MRYSKDENTFLAGLLPAGGSVTIKIIDPSTDTLVPLTSSVCSESIHLPGMYYFNLENNMTIPTVYKNYLYQMTDGDKVFVGKFVYGGYVDSVQGIIDNLWADIQTLIGDPSPDADIVQKLENLDSGLRQVLTNIADEIQENQINISKGTLKVMI